MAKIAVDIDSTLYDFETPAREAMLRLYKETGDRAFKEGAYHPWTEWRSPADVLTDENGSVKRWLDAIGLCHDANVIESMRPFDGSVETCQALIRAGHELLYISNRATEAAEPTEQWLLDNGFLMHGGYIEPSVMCLTGDKAPHMAGCQYIIDDRLKTVVEFVYDHEWKAALKLAASRVRAHGPEDGDPLYSEWLEALGSSLDEYYASEKPLTQEQLTRLNDVGEAASKAHVEKYSRKAFVKAYPYNQAATDIPGLYIAQTWAGLNEYLVKEALLPEAATIPLGVLG